MMSVLNINSSSILIKTVKFVDLNQLLERSKMRSKTHICCEKNKQLDVLRIYRL